MSILINKNTRVIVQGITGREAAIYSQDMLNYGTQIVAGVSPSQGGIWVLDEKVPVFDSMRTAVEATEANTSVMFVPAHRATDALYEAADSGVEMVVCMTEGLPMQDVSKVCEYMRTRNVRLVGPNTPGIIIPEEQKLGVYPSDCVIPGNVGVITRSSTLSYMVMAEMKAHGIGVSTCVGIGGDVIGGTTFVDALELFENDPYTERVLMIGEPGGLEECRAAKYAAYRMSKPVIGFITGLHIPEGKRLTHAGSYVDGGVGTTREKIEAFHSAGIPVTTNVFDIVDMLK